MIWTQVKNYLSLGHQICLMTVIYSQGSAPGRRGFKMMVVDNGDLHGSIGGGLMEHNLVELAKQHLSSQNHETFIKVQTHNKKSKNSSGMICSGTQTIAFNYFKPDDLSQIEQILNGESFIQLSSNGLELVNKASEETVIDSETNWKYTEKISTKPRLHLFGAGHVSLPTSELLVKLGFDVLLYDNRPHINTLEQNQFVKMKKVIDYQQALQQVAIKNEDYVILMTHKCAEDMLLLSQIVKISTKYTGVLGSKNKIKTMFNFLIEKGVDKEKLNQVHAPIGLSISSQTPEEIAVSIAAELILFRNQNPKKTG